MQEGHRGFLTALETKSRRTSTLQRGSPSKRNEQWATFGTLFDRLVLFLLRKPYGRVSWGSPRALAASAQNVEFKVAETVALHPLVSRGKMFACKPAIFSRRIKASRNLS